MVQFESTQTNSDPAGVASAADLHSVQFYETDSFLVDSVSRYIENGLKLGKSAVVIATASHLAALSEKLGDRVPLQTLARDGRFVILDAHEILPRIMKGPDPDTERFGETVSVVIESAHEASGGRGVVAFGELVDILTASGNSAGAIKLEQLWNDLARTQSFSLMCGYSMKGFSDATRGDSFRAVCAAHTHVSPTESYLLRSPEEQLIEVSLLQQRAVSLEHEITSRAKVQEELSRTLDELKRREKDLMDLLETAAEGIHMVSGDGIIRWANRAELDMLGYSAEEYIGRPIKDFHLDATLIGELMDRLTRGETVQDCEAPMRHRDGTTRWVVINSNGLWQDGKFVTTRCFSRDVTAVRKAAEEREALLESERIARAEADRAKRAAEAARQNAEAANRAKSEFLAVMSHELRTPLNAIGGYAELMELGVHGELSDRQRDSVERIQKNQRHLLGLINQVLNYARIETGNLKFEMADVSLNSALGTIEALVFPQLSAKSIDYEYHRCVNALKVRADAEKLQQILLNLLTNAVKFTPVGGRITVTVEECESVAKVHVADTGIGIPEHKIDKIFDAFVQVDPNYTREHEGVGLGLAISRDLARGMNADLAVKSVEGEGSIFTLTLRKA